MDWKTLQVPPAPAGAQRASWQVPPGERGWTRSHLGPRLTCGRGRLGPSGSSPPRLGPPGGRQRGPVAHGRGGGRGWLPAPALPRPGRRGRSVGTARRAHLAGSHPSARRGASWERGPGRRGLAALTRRAAEAPGRLRDGPGAGAGPRASGKVRAAPRSRAAWRPPGRRQGEQSGLGPRRAGFGPQRLRAGRGGHRWRPGARGRMGSGRGEAGRRPRGNRTPEPSSIVVGAEGRGSKTALETLEAAPWSLSRRVPGETSASRPSRARRASYSGDEEPFAHPAHNAAAAGRLHCLTITRAGFSPRPANPRDTYLWKIRAPSSISRKETGVIPVEGILTGKD